MGPPERILRNALLVVAWLDNERSDRVQTDGPVYLPNVASTIRGNYHCRRLSMADIEFGHLYANGKMDLIDKLTGALEWVKGLPDSAFQREQSICGIGTIDILEPEETEQEDA